MGNCFLYKRGSGSGGSGGSGVAEPTVKTVLGSFISLTDSSNKKLSGLRIFGKTTQNGTPSPDSPVPLDSVGDDGNITVKVGTSETDGNPQTISISTPNGLPGIPVASGGNYTDENGQQWLCDEVDFEKGVYIQRLKSIALKGTESIILWNASKGNFNFSVSDLSTTSDAILCSHLASKPGADIYGGKVTNAIAPNKQYRQIGFAIDGYTTVDGVKAYLASEYSSGNPVVILYVLNAEKTTALSAEQLAAFAELHTYQPNTTIFNDEGADMEVKYTTGG